MVNDHNWAVFLAPADPQGRLHQPNEPYYFERNNEITTWIRPFDYTDTPLSVGEDWQRAEAERKLQLARARAKADRPSSQAIIRGSTEWRRVTTVQGREYYYNAKTRVSQWNRPTTTELDAIESDGNNGEEEGLGVDGTEMTAEDAEWMLAQMGEEEEEEDDNDDDEEMASNVDEEKEGQNIDASVSKDERIARFKEMLCDIGVNPFGTWEMECKNYESDPRFALIDTPAEQRDLFEVVCKQVAAAAKTSKPSSSSSSSSNTKASSKDKAAEAANRVDMTGLLHPFDQLLCETVTKKKTSFAKFCQKNLKDPRFTSIKTSREREKRFNRHLEENIQ